MDAHLPLLGLEPTTNVCDVWTVQHQTYGYLPSRKASPPIGWYQIILLGDRGTCVLATCPGCSRQREGQDLNPWPVARKSSAYPLRPLSHTICWAITKMLIWLCACISCSHGQQMQYDIKHSLCLTQHISFPHSNLFKCVANLFNFFKIILSEAQVPVKHLDGFWWLMT